MNIRSLILAGALAAAFVVLLWDHRQAVEAGGKKKPGPKAADLNQVHLEIEAMHMIDRLDLKPGQMARLAKLAKETADKPRERKAPEASADYRKALLALHAALKSADEEKTDEAQQKLDALAEKEEVTFDDTVDVTDAAREKAHNVVRMLRVNQVTAYLANTEISDPIGLIEETMEENQDKKEDEWKDERERVARTVAVLLAGPDKGKQDAAAKSVETLLQKAGDYGKQTKAIKEEIRAVVGKTSSFDMLQNRLASDLAELLSNPRLSAVVEYRKKAE